MDYDTRGVAGKPTRDEDLSEQWQRMFSEERDQYYFFNQATGSIEWIEENQSHPEDHQSYPVGPFLLGDIPVRGTLVHQGDGIRDTTGPMPIKAGNKVSGPTTPKTTVSLHHRRAPARPTRKQG